MCAAPLRAFVPPAYALTSWRADAELHDEGDDLPPPLADSPPASAGGEVVARSAGGLQEANSGTYTATFGHWSQHQEPGKKVYSDIFTVAGCPWCVACVPRPPVGSLGDRGPAPVVPRGLPPDGEGVLVVWCAWQTEGGRFYTQRAALFDGGDRVFARRGNALRVA